jgi:hypothetical protein
MSDSTDESPPPELTNTREPTPYHGALAEFLQSHYTEHWNLLESEQSEQEHANRVLLELNKSAVPIEEASAPRLQAALHSAKQTCGMQAVAVTLWKTPENEELPACSVFWALGEAHIALKESNWQSLSDQEMQSRFKTALRRWQLWQGWQGRFRTAERLLEALLHSSHRDRSVFQESWNRWNMATEEFASPSLKSKSKKEAPLRWETLDLLERHQVSEETRRAIRRLLKPAWYQTPATLAHARRYFPDFSESELTGVTSEAEASISLALDDPPLRDYVCYLLLDFATADRELELRPFEEAANLARQLNCETRFFEVIAEELHWPGEQLAQLLDEPAAIDDMAEEL